ncbi:MAG: endolytic transglycosylase MltG [Candidatus Berkelbacteria bacterium]|nr:endolytic transglycosylase MltG [Candidatus Berkelbacteria bacterium]
MKPDISHYKKEKKHDQELVVRLGTEGLKKIIDKKSTLYFIAGTILVFLIFIISWVNFQKRPVADSTQDYKYFEITKGETTKGIGIKLKEAGLVRSDLAFYLNSKMSFKNLQAGNYKLAATMDMDEIIKKFQKGDVDAFSVTIPEGYRVLQIAKTLEEKGKVDPNKFIEAAIGTEGTLFPDTYVFPLNLEPAKIVREMKDDFEKRTQKYRLSADQLILASIVEREAKKDDERPKIAAVYRNRADQNMLLQADPTVQYALDTQKYLKDKSLDFAFWAAPTSQEIKDLVSPFNTYKQKGYPPAPICNPGIKSIEAAINPEPNFDYLYFFHDKNQQIHFSKTYTEHLKAIQDFGL